VITVSNFTKKSILDKYLIQESSISLITCPYLQSNQSNQSFPIKYKRHRLLMVTGAMKHKNFENGILGFLKSSCREKFVLTVVGIDPSSVDISKYPESIEWKYNITNLELSHIYSETSIVLFPSLLEGLGIPLLEAMEFGAKIVCSGNSVFPEVCGDSAVYFDPYSIDDIARAIDTCNDTSFDKESFVKILSFYGEKIIKSQVDSLLIKL